jgi:cytochrome c oxidase subunit 3
MAIFMGGWSMMLLALLFAYTDVRLQAAVWPPPGEPVPPHGLPALATLVLLGASLALERARRQPRPALAAPIALALVFLGLQMVVWAQLHRAGLHATSTLGSAFWTLTIFHGLHVVIAILGLTVSYAYTRSDQHFQTRLRNWAIFWHGLFVAWILIFVGVYLV